MQHLENSEVGKLLEDKWAYVIDAIESAFVDPTADMIPKTYLNVEGGDYRAMPAALGDFAGIKWIGVFPDNWKQGFSTTPGILVLNKRGNGRLLLTMECCKLTAIRTAAVSTIAAKYFTFPADVKKIGFVGCGNQASHHIEAYLSQFNEARGYSIDEVLLYDTAYISGMSEGWNNLIASKDVDFKVCDTLEELTSQSDIITLTTPSREPYLGLENLKPNVHINAVGADAVGKREVKHEVLYGAKNVICDDREQAMHSGELQYSTSFLGGYGSGRRLDVQSLNNIIRDNSFQPKGISLFDSTGVALEDLAVGTLVFSLLHDSRYLKVT